MIPPTCLAIAGVSLSFLSQGRYGFSLWDEGFLWYGAQRVMAGEVPIRDFMAYDPGRYYWSASLMTTAGDHGIIALRAKVATFQVLGLAAGLILTRCTDRLQMGLLFVATFILAAWMFPRHKLFDISLSLILIGMIAFLL